MYIRLEPNIITLKELIENDTITCGVIEHIDEKNRKLSIYVNEVKSTNNLVIVVGTRLYKSDYSDLVRNLETLHSNVLLAYDRSIKTLFMDDCASVVYESYIEYIKNQFTDYNIINIDSTFNTVCEYYHIKVNELLDSKFEESMRFEEYNIPYNNALEKDLTRVEIDYINNDTDYDIAVEMPENFKICTINTIHSYVKDPKIINESICELTGLIMNNQYYFIKHAINMAHKHLLQSIVENPSSHLKDTLKLKESLKEAGKTLTVTLEDNTVYKVYNDLINGRYFISVTGHKQVPVSEIIQITFGRNTIYSRKDAV